MEICTHKSSNIPSKTPLLAHRVVRAQPKQGGWNRHGRECLPYGNPDRTGAAFSFAETPLPWVLSLFHTREGEDLARRFGEFKCTISNAL